jgi:DNA-binding transcriptional LysR family regulator
MDLKHVETFLAVFEEGSVTRAAHKLNIVQPAVSGQIKHLEAELDVRLFDRSPRGIAPTSAARALYRLFVQVVADFRTAESLAHALRQVPSNRIAVGVNPYVANAVMGDVLQALRDRLPQVEVQVEEAFSPALIEQVNGGSLDVAVVSGGAELAEPPRSLATIVLVEEELVFVEKSVDDLSSADSIALADVAQRRLVLSRSRHGFRSDLDRAAATCGLTNAAELESDAPGPLLDLVAHGNLSTVVPETTARRAMEHLPLRILRIVSPCVTRQVICVHRKDRPLSGILLEFVEIVRFELRRGVDQARVSQPE